MDATRSIPVHEQLSTYAAALADMWCHVMPHLDTADLRPRLLQFSRQAVATLLAEPFERQGIEDLGRELADLDQCVTVDLGQLIEVLIPQVCHILDPEQIHPLNPRLTAFQSALTTGFVTRLRAIFRDKREQVRATLTETCNRLVGDLCASEERLRTVVQHTPVALFTINRSGIVTFAAGKGFQGLHVLPDTLVGQSIFTAIPILELPEHLAAAWAGESFIAVSEVDALVFEIHYGPLYDRTGAIIGAVGVALDVTVRARLETALLRARWQSTDVQMRRQCRMVQQFSVELVEQIHTLRKQLDTLPPQIDDVAHARLMFQIERLTCMANDLKLRVYEVHCAVPPAELVDHASHDSGSIEELTAEEVNMVRLLALGKTNQQIGDILGISTKGVEKRLTKIFTKLNVMTRTEAVVAAMQLRLLSQQPADEAAKIPPRTTHGGPLPAVRTGKHPLSQGQPGPLFE